jgi:two-component system response regulator
VSTPNRPILLVEDNDDDAALALRALGELQTESGQDVTRARNGEEACAYLFGDNSNNDSNNDSNDGSRGDSNDGSAPERPLPSIVLLDLHMPRVDGLEVLRRIRADERTRLLPVVMLTSSDEDADVVRSYRLGVNSFVRKPVDQAAFRSAVRSVGDYWLDQNVPPPEPAS